MSGIPDHVDRAASIPSDSLHEALLLEAGLVPTIGRAVLSATVAACQRLGCWRKDPGIPPPHYERLLDVFELSGAIARRHPFEAAIVAPPG